MRLRAVGLLLAFMGIGFLSLLAGCDSSVDRQRETICRRTLPALVTAALDPRLLHVGRGPAPQSVRVDYVVAKRQHRIDCLFDNGAGLVGLVADQKSVSGATLFLLKRYYLDTSDSEKDDPKTSGHGGGF